ncbi:MAG: hypothetical protein MUE73_12290 [Planctomycetes bacterium]|jgi:hypothetical protein|nr:hypothetical protein [Planctomycetota bacterium]
MTIETARTVLIVILGAGTVSWLAALLFHRRTFARRPPRPDEPEAAEEVSIRAEPAVVRRRLLSTLRGGLAGLGPVSLGESSADRVTGELSFAGRSKKPVRFEIDLGASGAGTLATCRFRNLPGNWMGAVSGAFVYFISPAALAAAAVVFPRMVLGSEDPAVRGQVVQAVQIIHFLWPPFLFCGLTRYIRKLCVGAFRALLRNMAAA